MGVYLILQVNAILQFVRQVLVMTRKVEVLTVMNARKSISLCKSSRRYSGHFRPSFGLRFYIMIS